MMDELLSIGGYSDDYPFKDKIENVDYWTVYCGSFRNITAADKWCEENCKGIYYYGMPHPLYWKFSNKNDAIQFRLTWG